METSRLAGRRRSLAYLLAIAMSAPVFAGIRSVVAWRPYDPLEHFDWRTPAQLRAMGLSEAMTERVADFRKEMLARSFADFAALKTWLLDAIADEYRQQQLTVHQRCILSHTELALLASNFPRGCAES